MANYSLRNVGKSKYLAVANYSGSLSNNQNVSGMTSTAITTSNNEHIWVIDSLGTGVYVKSYVNTSYGLNVYRSGDPYNCDVHIISGNETDAKVNFIHHAATGYYKIKLTNYNLYLTASDSNVYWGAYGGENDLNQSWNIKVATPNTTSSPTTSKSLTMPQNVNQRYTGNDEVIQNAGCCVCCVCDVASYYKGSKYTLSQMKNAGVYTDTDATCRWGNAPSASFAYYTASSQSDYFSKIRSEINAGRPVMVYMIGEYQHWVVAYGYTNGGTANSHIKVLDPYGDSTSTVTGRDITLAAAMDIQEASTINKLLLTSAK